MTSFEKRMFSSVVVDDDLVDAHPPLLEPDSHRGRLAHGLVGPLATARHERGSAPAALPHVESTREAVGQERRRRAVRHEACPQHHDVVIVLAAGQQPIEPRIDDEREEREEDVGTGAEQECPHSRHERAQTSRPPGAEEEPQRDREGAPHPHDEEEADHARERGSLTPDRRDAVDHEDDREDHEEQRHPECHEQ
jgi:hypothetical protein